MDISDIIAKKLLGKANDDEIQKLDVWLADNINHRRIYSRLLEDRSLSNRMEIMETIDKDKRWKLLKKRIDESSGKSHSSLAVFSLIAKVAAVILIVVAIGWAVFQRDNRPISQHLSAEVENAIIRSEQIGKTGANVKVKKRSADGWNTTRTVRLSSNAALASLLDESVDADAECELQTLQGSEYWLTLEDGTLVHLDYNSRIFFPVHFSGNKRQVYLDGTAYFLVTEDKERPFFVKTANGIVKEYGTEFVVNTRYSDETLWHTSPKSTEVILVNGSISMITQEGREYMMKPRDRMLVSGNHIKGEHNVDTTPYTAWNEGKFKFDDCRIDNLISVISKWYGCSVVFMDQESRNVRLTGTFDRYGKLSDLLQSVNAVTGVDIEQHGDTIIVGMR